MFSSASFAAADTTTPPLDKALSKQIDKLLTDYMSGKNHVPGLAVAVISIPTGSNKPQVSEFFYGTTKKGAKQLPDASTIFGIGSESKVFTAVLLAGILHQGLGQLSGPLYKQPPPGRSPARLSGKENTPLQLAPN